MVIAPFSASFMLPVPEASIPAVEICSDKSLAGTIISAATDIIVRNENDLEKALDRGIVVDHVTDVVDELDDQLGLPVARGGFSGKNLDARCPIAFRIREDGLIERNCLDRVEKLTLVFVDSLDLDIEQSRRDRRECQGAWQWFGRARSCLFVSRHGIAFETHGRPLTVRASASARAHREPQFRKHPAAGT